MLWSASAMAQPDALPNLIKATDKLVRDGECDRAIKILTKVGDTYSGNADYQLSLERAYLCAAEYDSAHAIVLKLIAGEPSPAGRQNFLVEQGQIYLKEGKKDSAEASFQQAIDLAPDNARSYQTVARGYMASGYYNDAVRIYLQGRSKLKNYLGFAADLGRLYEVMRNYGDAAREYFQLVAADTSQARLVDSRMDNLIDMASGEKFDTGLEKALSEIVQDHPKNMYAYKYYAQYLIAAGRLDEAFASYCVVDSLSDGQGSQIVYFCRLASEQGNYKMIERAYEYLKTMYPDSPNIINADFILGSAYYDHRLYQNAVDIYNDIISRSQSSRDLAEAMFYLGFTKYAGLHEPQVAIDIFNDLRKKYPNTGSARLAALYVADCYLAMAQPVVAESLYMAIELRSLPQKYQEELLFQEGELYFFIGEYDAARKQYGELMQSFPKSVYVNDCLRRIMAITEHPDMEEVTLKIYSEALYAQFRFEYDSSLVFYDNLKSREGSPLVEIAWFDAGRIHAQLGQAQQALEQFDSLVAKFPDGTYAPLAVEQEGDIYANLLGDYAQASKVYEDLLLNYPDCLNGEQVRRKLNRVEQQLDIDKKSPKS
jgi:tetratricopeptide (TPR) repeat protein